MLKRLLVLAFAVSSCLFAGPSLRAQPMHCMWGTPYYYNGVYTGCTISDCPGGCEYCEVTPQTP
ncbi:MAG TPA: hypothetical protein VGR02_05090 [Thermoanaerobaculia bacterium]|nr:hypothetical protein [Thermoanaerobaculia bacterium]